MGSSPRRGRTVVLGLGVGLGVLTLAGVPACTPSAPPTPVTQPAQATGAPASPTQEPTGGGSSVPSAPTSPTPSASALQTHPDTGEKVEVDGHDRVRKLMGQAGTLSEATSNQAAFALTVSKPVRLAHCTMRGFGDRLTPKNGTFVRIHVKATLSKTLADHSVDLTSAAFVPVNANGDALAANAWSEAAEGCTVRDAVDIMVLAGETAQGQLILDIPKDTASIAFDPEGSKGWSWRLKG